MISQGQVVRYLKNNHQAISSLTTCRENIERIRHINNLRVVKVPVQDQGSEPKKENNMKPQNPEKRDPNGISSA